MACATAEMPASGCTEGIKAGTSHLRPLAQRNSAKRSSRGAGKRALSEGCLREHVDHALPTLRVGGNAEIHGADLLNRTARAAILWPNDEENLVDGLEGVLEHQALHLAVVPAAPIATSEKRPANLDPALCGVEDVVTRRSNDLPGSMVDGHQRAPRIQGIGKELPEDVFLVTIRVRVLLPDERIGRNGKQRGPVVFAQRPQLEELTSKSGLAIEHHGGEMT